MVFGVNPTVKHKQEWVSLCWAAHKLKRSFPIVKEMKRRRNKEHKQSFDSLYNIQMFRCNESVTSLDLCPVIVLLDIQFMNLLLVVCWLGILNCSENTCLLHFINFSILEKMLLLWLTVLFLTLYWRPHPLQYDEGWTMNCVEILSHATAWSGPSLAVFYHDMYRICSPDDKIMLFEVNWGLFSLIRTCRPLKTQQVINPSNTDTDCLWLSSIKLTTA